LHYLKQGQTITEQGRILIFGIKPDRPETGFGYIKAGKKLQIGNEVEQFEEKPDLKKVKEFIQSPDYAWNAGIFIWSVKAIISAFEKYLPEVSKYFTPEINIYFTDKERDYIQKSYGLCQTISIDYGIMEKADNVYVIPGDFGWSDIGTWNSLFEFVSKDENNNAINGKYVFTRNAENCIINVSNGTLLAVNNVKDLIIVESDDIILVADKNKEQDIRHVVNEIKSKYREKFI